MGPDSTPPVEVRRASFVDLSPHQLYALLQLRSAVFVVEQDCAFLEPDGRDTEPDAEHLWTVDGEGVSSTLRLLHETGSTWSIGRIVTRPDVRSSGLAAHLLRTGLERVREHGASHVVIAAQAHLRDWYARFGFFPSGPRYLDAGILHLPMALTLERREP